MTTETSMDAAYRVWCKAHNISIPTEDDLAAFMVEQELPGKIKRDVERWLVDHPDYLPTESNRKRINAWLALNELPALYDNLDQAYAHLKPNLEHRKRVVPPDPNKPEMRIGVWRNGVFEPDPNYVSKTETVYAQHADVPVNVGQSDPARVAAGEPTIRKSVANMTAAEYLHFLNTSRSFQKKMDES